jgi:hypothetical protein
MMLKTDTGSLQQSLFVSTLSIQLGHCSAKEVQTSYLRTQRNVATSEPPHLLQARNTTRCHAVEVKRCHPDPLVCRHPHATKVDGTLVQPG